MLVISTESSSLSINATHCVNVHGGDFEIVTRQAVIISVMDHFVHDHL